MVRETLEASSVSTCSSEARNGSGAAPPPLLRHWMTPKGSPCASWSGTAHTERVRRPVSRSTAGSNVGCVYASVTRTARSSRMHCPAMPHRSPLTFQRSPPSRPSACSATSSDVARE